MKKILYSMVAVAALTLASCSDFTDLQPKGKNLLSTTDQLEMLLNAEFKAAGTDTREIAGGMIFSYSNVATEISKPTKSASTIVWTYDEESMDKWAELTNRDNDYSNYYGIIGTISNPILNQIDAASGDAATKKQLKAEALTLRAWSFYILVNKFAKAYNPATAATDRGIILMTEDKDIQQSQPQSTVQEVYDQILKDINEAIALDALPAQAVNKMRANKAAAYAVKAWTLMSMQDWDGAEAAAKQALGVNGTINDYNKEYLITTTGMLLGKTYTVIGRGSQGTEEDYFFMPGNELVNSYSTETIANFEKGYAYYDKMRTVSMAYDYMMDGGQAITGEVGTMMTYDLNSYWNNGGLRSPQMYLICAECELHKGNIDASMDYLDQLRVCRIDADNFQPLKGNVTTASEAKAKVKQVTMEEDVFFIDIYINEKRWNQISGWEASYSRTLAGTTYTITPDSKMWIFPFPQNVMNNNPLVKQNYKE